MPLLPPKNSLDYNPDSTVSASKKLKTIALERMKNPLLDPDQSVLSTLDNQKNLGANVERLIDIAGLFHSTILRIQNTLSARFGRGLSGGAPPALSPAQVIADYNRNSYANRLQQSGSRFVPFHDDDSRNSTATPASSGDIDFDGDDGDDDGTVSTSRPTGRQMTIFAGEGNWSSLMFSLISLTRRMNIIVSSNIKPFITRLTSKQVQSISSIYLMVRSSYNDIIRPLSRRDVGAVSDPFTGVTRTPNPSNVFRQVGFDNIEQELVRQNQYADEILNTFDTARKELLLNLTVVINSWRQNTATGQQTEMGEELERDFQQTAARNKDLYIAQQRQATGIGEGQEGAGRKPRGRPRKDTMSQTLVGCGRNFYGEKINDSRDIPTIWRSYKDCPTKYLL